MVWLLQCQQSRTNLSFLFAKLPRGYFDAILLLHLLGAGDIIYLGTEGSSTHWYNNSLVYMMFKDSFQSLTSVSKLL